MSTPTDSLTFPPLTDNALNLLFDRPYLQPNESPSYMFARVAEAVAAPEGGFLSSTETMEIRDAFYRIMLGQYFLPNTPTLVHAGVPIPEGKKGRCLSACFVDSPTDDLDSITRIGHAIPHVETAGGGMGWGLSRLRPKGDKLGDKPPGPNGACGPVKVLHWYAEGGRIFTQGATRPGAHMAQLHVNHPDILEFIHAKDNCLSPSDPLANVNISVQVSDCLHECRERRSSVDTS